MFASKNELTALKEKKEDNNNELDLLEVRDDEDDNQ